jgi:uncharacterized protein YllA (UPF0747 family)
VKGDVDVQQLFRVHNIDNSIGSKGCIVMPQLRFTVSEEIATKLRKKAAERNWNLSKYIAEIVKKEVDVDGWPEGYFEQVVGSWKGQGIEEPEDLPLQERDFFKLKDWKV